MRHSDPLGSAAVVIRQLTAEESWQVPDVWNAAWSGPIGNPYPLTTRLWSERLGSRHHSPHLLVGAFDDGRLVGYAHGKLGASLWQPANVGWLSSFAVRPSHRRRGLGTALVSAVLAELASAGAVEARFGSDADHLLPGAPSDSPPATWRLLRRAGARFAQVELDLHLDLTLPLPDAPLPAGWTATDHDPEGAASFVAEHFPGRWAEELAAYVAGGARVVTVRRSQAGSPAEGFCVTFSGEEEVTSPGLHWERALRAEVGGGRIGALGPLGVSAAARGERLGTALVRHAAASLASGGAAGAVLNWTTLGTFYGRLGARVVRAYQRCQVDLAARADAAAREQGGAK